MRDAFVFREEPEVELGVAAAIEIHRTAERIARNNITLDEILAWTNEGRLRHIRWASVGEHVDPFLAPPNTIARSEIEQ